jgi:homoserine kinase type II
VEDKFQIKNILQHYRLGEIISINDQSHGYANKNFSVECCDANIFVRFCEQQSLENIRKEILLMSILKKRSFKTAYPIQRMDGEYLSYSQDVPIMVYEFLEGELPDLNVEVVSEIAEAVANLSTIEYPLELSRENAISLFDCRRIISSESFQRTPYSDVKGNFISLFRVLEDKLSIELPRGIVHGDVFPDNTIFSNNSLVGIIDFEEFAIDNLLFDVGMTINGFCFVGVKMDKDLFGTFIRKYHSIRELSQQELDRVIDYICWGAVGMTSWHLNQLLFKSNREQLKRVRTLLERARLVDLDRSSLEVYLSSVI